MCKIISTDDAESDLYEAAKSNVLSKKLINQLQESMTYSSISFINWTIEVLTLIKNRLECGDSLIAADSDSEKAYAWISSLSKRFSRYDKEKGILVEI